MFLFYSCILYCMTFYANIAACVCLQSIGIVFMFVHPLLNDFKLVYLAACGPTCSRTTTYR